ncbi:hypothetical protein IST455A_04802 [Burkholderia multivorans]|uniref:hypothetical protein n=1 Tax=Burkholderia multivorans TaxID=87883 RepID=UPI001997124B|nr:hypothetical protein [Burkholderia multivorans]CAB5285421.1 hypothetical protein IST419_04841 [Burkholderia multivorans]CAB5293652.1 hypothetical protein IST495A_05262 [Burkholderia multivorans]CAB5302312.1 hypothetical protein IST455A_04802 [Burkholderia multivorans]CAB5302487.1 hypothetical protein IST424_04672 [Burkholderia multivorans]CAB5303454.1 hypothetical protein IST453_04619 [Burkholderia multivorans]
MRAPLTDVDLRAAWHRLRMAGDFDTSIRHRAVRLVVESAARAMQDREQARLRSASDVKRRAANDVDE